MQHKYLIPHDKKRSVKIARREHDRIHSLRIEGRSYRSIADEYGVSRFCIYNILMKPEATYRGSRVMSPEIVRRHKAHKKALIASGECECVGPWISPKAGGVNA